MGSGLPIYHAQNAIRDVSDVAAWRGVSKFVGPRCFDGVMSSSAYPSTDVVTNSDRLEVLFGELAELAGQRNAIDGRIVQIAAQIERDGLWGATGARSVAGLIGWKL